MKELGEGVEGVSKGTYVVPTVRRPDNCPNCLAGESDMCLTGGYGEHGIHGLHGFASETAISDSRFLVKVPRGLEEIAVLLEPLSIGEKAVSQIFRIQRRMVWEPKEAFVVGAGPLGLLTSMILRIRGLDVSVAATRSQESLKAEIVREIGGSYLSVRESPINELGKTFDMVIEATGGTEPAIDATRLLRRNGVMCFLGNYRRRGVYENFQELLYGMVLGNRLLFGSVNSNREHFEMGIRDMKRIHREFSGILNRLITKALPLADFKEAFNPSHEDIKTVIRFR